MEPNQVEVKQSSTGNLQALVVLGITGLVALLFWPVLLDIWRYSFDDGTYSHAFLIPFVALYVLYDCQKQLVFRKTSGLWLVALTAILALMLLFYLSQLSLPVRFLMPFVLMATLLSVFHYQHGLVVFSLIFIFVTPIWGVLSPPLQQLSTAAVDFVMAYTSIPSYFEGNVVSIPSGRFEIANGCSGLRYFITSLFLCLLYIYFNIRSFKNAIKFFALCMLGALLVNWIRIITIIVIGHETQMQSPIIEDHNNLGWYLYLPYTLVVFYYGSKIADVSTKKATSVPFSPISWKPLVFSFFALCTFSPALYDWPYINATMLNSSEKNTTSALHSALEVDRYQGFERQSFQTKQQKIELWVYTFSGLGLDNKASFYLNSILPQSLIVENRAKKDKVNLVSFRSPSGKPALFAFSYLTHLGMTPSLSELRKQRIKLTLTGRRQTAIVATSAECQRKHCEEAAKLLTQQLNNLAKELSSRLL